MGETDGTDGTHPEGVHVADDRFPGVQALGRVIAAVADGVLVLDDEGVVVLANRAATRMFGREDGDLVGTEFGYPVPVGRTADIDVLVPGGNRSVEMRAALTEIDGARFRVATFRDVTQRLRADRQLRNAIRMREELLALAAHELKTPVTVISGMSVSLRDAWDTLDNDTRRMLIGRVADRSIELQDLVIEVLSRRSSDQWGSEPAVELVDPLAQRAIESWPELDIHLDIDDELEVWADGGHVVEILANLVDNARKYGAPPVTISASVVDDVVEIRVIDEGAGVPAPDRASMFETGWRSDEATTSGAEGTGLGLGIVRKLASANRGTIRYEERSGESGACFVLRLPAEHG